VLRIKILVTKSLALTVTAAADAEAEVEVEVETEAEAGADVGAFLMSWAARAPPSGDMWFVAPTNALSSSSSMAATSRHKAATEGRPLMRSRPAAAVDRPARRRPRATLRSSLKTSFFTPPLPLLWARPDAAK
jgi:hypothetical protein